MKKNILIITIIIIVIALSSGVTYMLMANKYKNYVPNNKEENKENDNQVETDKETDTDSNKNNSEDEEENEYIHVEEFNKKVNDKNVKLTFKFYESEKQGDSYIKYDIYINENKIKEEYGLWWYYSEGYGEKPNAINIVKDNILKNITSGFEILKQDKEYLLYIDTAPAGDIGSSKTLYIINEEGELLYVDLIQRGLQSINSCENCQGELYNFNYETGYKPYNVDNGIWYLEGINCGEVNEYKITIYKDKVNKKLITTSKADMAGAC